jgi:uncharacterized protein (DUF427 family)
MTLTLGSGPFGHQPAGRLNFDPPDRFEYVEPHAKRIRAKKGGDWLVDSKRVKLLHQHGRLPIFFFPEGDVQSDAIQRHDNPALEGYVHLPWDEAEEWFEEDEPAIVHPRDPFHRVDVLDTSRHVRVAAHGEELADTKRARVLFETSLPPRWYIPPEDVRMDLLEDSDLQTGCAYKGFASYWSANAGGEFELNLAWVYREPRPEAARVKDLTCFFNERVDLELDGELQERPVTPWSKPMEGPQKPP